MYKFKRLLPKLIPFALCVAILISVPCMVSGIDGEAVAQEEQLTVLSLWQIDGFEGGRGSRASYLQDVADSFSDEFYVTVTSISAQAARENLKAGVVPDVISFGAGAYGLESYIRSYDTWCRGGYCLLTLSENADFSDVNAQNTIINAGIDNLSEVAALFCGVGGANSDRPTGAYVKLIGGKYKYLLGTQRDIFRLKTRGVQFSVKAVTEFNDLYQNISVTTTDPIKAEKAKIFIEKLLNNGENIAKIGLFKDGYSLYDDQLGELEGLTYNYKLVSPVSQSTREEIEKALSDGDINLLKNLLK